MGGARHTVALNTGGGDCPGLNAVIRAIVKRATIQLDWKILGIRDSFDGILGPKTDVIELTRDRVARGLSKGGSIFDFTWRGISLTFGADF
ncbi:MAG: 6-phosphofructokinase [Planctomycetes bacterium]|nr:6-phosphofructokinase [Planctomycetota bacterium]